MPDTLYPAGAQLLGASADVQAKTQELAQKKTDTTVQSGDAASTQLGEDRRSGTFQQQQQAKQALEKIKLMKNHIQVTPQLALGIMGINNDDPSIMQLTDQDMDVHMLAAFIGGEYKKSEQKLKAPKPFRMRVGGNDVDGMMEWDENSKSWNPRVISEGGPHFDPNKPKGGKDAEDRAAKEEATERDRFIKHYEKLQGEVRNDEKTFSYDPTNPDLKAKLEKNRRLLADDREKYNQLRGKEATAGGYTPPPASTAPSGGDDIDAIFNEAITGAK